MKTLMFLMVIFLNFFASAALLCRSAHTRSANLDFTYLPSKELGAEYRTLGGIRLSRLKESPRKVLEEYFKVLAAAFGSFEKFAELFYGQHAYDMSSRDWYHRNMAKVFLDRAKEINPTWDALVIHPGLVQQSGLFFHMVREKAWEKLSPSQVYEAFSKHLGVSTVYRAIALPKSSDIDNFRKQALLSSFLQEKMAQGSGQEVITLEPLIDGKIILNSDANHVQMLPIATAIGHHHHQTNGRFILSVTEQPEIGIEVAKDIIERRNLVDHQVVLFTYKIPNIERIGHGLPMKYSKPECRGRFCEFSEFYYNLTGSEVLDSDVETFIHGGLSAAELVDVRVVP